MNAPPAPRPRLHREPFIDDQLFRAHALGSLPLEAARRGAARVRRPERIPAEFATLADDAERSGRLAEAVGFARVAEFFSPRPSAAQEAAYERYLNLLQRAFGGFDSVVEEFDPIWRGIGDAGFDVVAFDGPGQGAARTRSGVAHTHDWERPVAAVADRLDLRRFALVGLSMGGYWALRAAAFEPRVAAVVSWSPVFDWTARLPRPVARLVRRAATWRGFMNASVRLRMRLFPVLRHVVAQANWMSGGSEPVDAVRWLLAMRAEHVASERVRAPALLMVGERDRFQPSVLGELQARALTNAEVTLRRFTAAEGAADHMQLGNLELATRVLTGWLQQRFGEEDRDPAAPDAGTAA